MDDEWDDTPAGEYGSAETHVELEDDGVEPEAPPAFDPSQNQDARLDDAPVPLQTTTLRQVAKTENKQELEASDYDLENDPDVKPRDERLEAQFFGGKQVVAGLNFDKYGDIPIQTSGKDVPPPLESFETSALHPLLKHNIKLAKYKSPTPVQTFSVPIVTAGRDLMSCAQTGSGKTAGFLFPILSQAFYDGPSEDSRSDGPRYGDVSPAATPLSLILAPTRELAVQIYEESRKFAYRSWVRPCVAYGGTPMGDQMRDLSRGCGLLVATPGRLVDFIERGKVSLKKVRYLVLDEADRMLDMGFEPQIRRIVEQEKMPRERQTLMFSATFPRDIQVLARDFLNDYIFLSIGRVGGTTEDIRQTLICVENEHKRSLLVDMLSADPSLVKEGHADPNLTLVFVETKRLADELCVFLAEHGFPATAIHGDRTQREREDALASFKIGRRPILIATAVASRGLDIPNVNHIINYDLPNDIDDYVHRIGRTGRAGNEGKATAFFCPEGRDLNLVKDFYQLLTESKQHVPDFLKKFVKEGRGGGDAGMRGGRGGRSFGATDYRQEPGGKGFGDRGAGGLTSSSEGDWKCTACRVSNFARRTECYKCNEPRPEGVGSGAPGYSGGGFGARTNHPPAEGDWNCTDCNRSNFARRTECFKCQAPRPEGAGSSDPSYNRGAVGDGRGKASYESGGGRGGYGGGGRRGDSNGGGGGGYGGGDDGYGGGNGGYGGGNDGYGGGNDGYGGGDDGYGGGNGSYGGGNGGYGAPVSTQSTVVDTGDW
ncbi:DEAD-box ATP-dependent RNA helicase [Chytriomyces hyalinus]|nr:DEAD-box ATP-dependent RNA helicase [Chytriomyces hyalinus]